MVGLSIDWDKYTLIIDAKKVYILSGEFHYWRIPDRDRWLDILKMYKIAGLNAIRIYFHWGYHHPSESEMVFEGNRDIEYLLKLCEKIGLYVLIAQGPYICAETNAGGYPGWILAKRDVRIKHVNDEGKTEYDPKYMEYCRQWYENVISHIKSHQITEDPNGCIIGFQVENEYFENPQSSRKYMEELIKYAHEFGITVPIFHNDALEAGSWNNLVDLYGFDKYPIWAPKFPNELPIPKWSFRNFSKKVDYLEKKVRSFGGSATKSPIFIPELQGGWFNHWGIPYGYDELYDFYGSTYQKMILQSIAAQGSTMMSLYMFYGGTTWGSLPNPEVYSSYDYSACIREFGYISDRLRHVRLFALFIKSFNNSFINTDLVEEPTLTCDQDDIFHRQRRGNDGTDFYFFRNFNKNQERNFIIQLSKNIKIPKKDKQTLTNYDSFIAVGQHEIDGFFLEFCSLNIVLKGRYLNGIILVVVMNGGELHLRGNEFKVKGDTEVFIDKGFSRFSFPKEGFSCISNSEEKKLYIISLTIEKALTLNASFSNSEIKLAWGPYSLYFNENNSLEIETIENQQVWLLSSQKNVNNFKEVNNSFIPGLKSGTFGKIFKIPKISFEKWYKINIDWTHNSDEVIWKEINFNKEKDPINHHFTCGHVLYKCEFIPSELKSLELEINARHKIGIWLNNHFIGGHDTYSIDTAKPGAMDGNDSLLLGAKKYDLSRGIQSDENILFIITENLGHNKNFFIENDARNPRGILSAKFSQKLVSEKWYITGIDTTTLRQSYNTAGFLGEKFDYHLGKGENWLEIQGAPKITPEDQIIWYKTVFTWKIQENQRIPLRIHLEGKHNISIFLNGLYIGKYWGKFGPQHDFYIMDKILNDENVLVLACWTTDRDKFSVSIKPYKIKLDSGNLDEKGKVFATEKHIIPL